MRKSYFRFRFSVQITSTSFPKELSAVLVLKEQNNDSRGEGVVSRPNSLPLPFRTPGTQAGIMIAYVTNSLVNP